MDTRLLYLLSKSPVSTPPVARVAVTTTQLISTTLTPTWNTTSFSANGTTASTSGVVVPLQGYYLVQATATFSSSTSSTYAAPAVGSTGRIDIVANSRVVSLGSATAQAAAGVYASTVSDLVYAAQGSTITASVSAIPGSGAIYLWSAGSGDTYSSFLSVTYVCS